jgi:hypothetical protein
LPKPVLQLTSVQVPLEHETLALGRLQATPQAPQLVREVREVSQPLLVLPSQLPQPAVQVGEHTPELQVVVPWALVQLLPQAPQLVVEVSAASHPLVSRPSQLPQPVLQAIAQAPRVQDALPLVLLHTVPQVPQLLVLVWVLTSQPLLALPSQLPQPALQEAMAHEYVAHVAVALARVQATPQALQLVSVFSGASQPLPVLPSQSP